MESQTLSASDPNFTANQIAVKLSNPFFIIGILAVLVVIYVAYWISSMTWGASTTENSAPDESSSFSFFGILWTILMAIISLVFLTLLAFVVLSILHFVFDIDVFEPQRIQMERFLQQFPILRSIFNAKMFDVPPPPKPVVPSAADFRVRKQVFNIPGNRYTYGDARAVCSAYGAKLATQEQVQDAYNKGANWCRYGWSEGQMALFPTQASTFNELQQHKGHEHDCGRIGVNGGYIANPDVRFGVNCYGVKPEITKEEADLMAVEPVYPESKEEKEFRAKVDGYKSQLASILVSPFDAKDWDEPVAKFGSGTTATNAQATAP